MRQCRRGMPWLDLISEYELDVWMFGGDGGEDGGVDCREQFRGEGADIVKI